MKKIFISVPMRGRTNENIKGSMNRAKKVIEAMLEEPVEVIDSFIEDQDYTGKPIACLGESLKRMQDADLFVNFEIPYWVAVKGCEIEYEVARRYGIEYITLPAMVCYTFDEYEELRMDFENRKSMTARAVESSGW